MLHHVLFGEYQFEWLDYSSAIMFIVYVVIILGEI